MKPKDVSVKIEKNVPINRIGRTSRKSQYPWSKMEVGDSFHVDVSDGRNINSIQCSIYAAAKSYALYNHLDIKFTTRKEEGGFRIWRVE